MSRRAWGWAGWLAGVVILCALPIAPRRDPGTGDSLAGRLLGPIGGLAANLQWVRADGALRRGRVERFLSRARTALELCPQSAEGWHYLAWQQAYELGSPERDSDPARRLAWVEAGLATAAEGERRAAEPGSLAFLAGLILIKVATLDGDLPWPGGRERMWLDAAEHFERAGRLGYAPTDSAAMQRAAERAAERAAGESRDER